MGLYKSEFEFEFGSESEWTTNKHEQKVHTNYISSAKELARSPVVLRAGKPVPLSNASVNTAKPEKLTTPRSVLS
jgi:hypothetical protein